MFKKNKNNHLKFVAQNEAMLGDLSIHPKSANFFIPEWWKKVPYSVNRIKWIGDVPVEKPAPTVKQCPSFAQWFGQGYVLPSWCDIKIKHDPVTDIFTWNAGRDGSPYTIDYHESDQFLNHADFTYLGRKPSLVFKFVSPWYAITPKGWSLYQFPMFYDNSKDWVVLPGIIDADVVHEINLQVLYFGNGEDIFIPKGTPLAQYVPFKRETLKHKIEKNTEKNNLTIKTSQLKISSKLHKGAVNMRKEQDVKVVK